MGQNSVGYAVLRRFRFKRSRKPFDQLQFDFHAAGIHTFDKNGNAVSGLDLVVNICQAREIGCQFYKASVGLNAADDSPNRFTGMEVTGVFHP